MDSSKHKPTYYDGNSSRKADSWSGSESQEGNSGNRDRGPDCNWNQNTLYHGKTRDISRNAETLEEQGSAQSVQQPTSLPTYKFSPADYSCVDSNSCTLSTMSYYSSPCCQMKPISINPNTAAMPMPSEIDMKPKSNSAVNSYANIYMPAESIYSVVGMGNNYQYSMVGTTEAREYEFKRKLDYCRFIPPVVLFTDQEYAIFLKNLENDFKFATDQLEYECKQQKQDYCRSVIPPVVPFTEQEVAAVLENLEDEYEFDASSRTVITWLKRGECTKQNAGVFYKILESTNNCIREMQFDKVSFEESLNEAKNLMKKHADMHLPQLTLITKIHKSISVQKNWDQFTKAQQENIEAWRKQVEVMRNLKVEEVVNELEDEEMKLSEDEDGKKKSFIAGYCRSVVPPVVPFTEQESAVVLKNLKDDCEFAASSHTVITWLERGECTKQNAGIFYSILESTSNRIRRIKFYKEDDEKALNAAKTLMKKRADMHLSQLTLITEIHKSISEQKNWDQFTKAQQENIEAWREQVEVMRNQEIKLTEDEDGKKSSEPFSEQQKRKLEEEVHKLRAEIDTLHRTISGQAVDLIIKDMEMTFQQALQNSKKKLPNLSTKHSKDEAQLKELRALKRQKVEKEETDLASDGNFVGSSTNGNSTLMLENEVRLIGLISVFLNARPFGGANIDYICSHLHQIDSTIKTRDVENLMSRFPSLFREDSTGIDDTSLEKKWSFTGFQA